LLKWGSQGSENGQFSKVTPGIDVDTSGYVYVIDKEGANVQKFDGNGKLITKWGSEGDDDGQFTKPEDIAVDSKTGKVYVTDTGNSRVQVFNINN
jgi:tripartite motif-containing protein 71